MEIVDAVDGGALVVAPWQEVTHLQDAQNVNSGGKGVGDGVWEVWMAVDGGEWEAVMKPRLQG
jgi:hypothetical protein